MNSKLIKKALFIYRYLYHKIFSGFHLLGRNVIFDKNITIVNSDHIAVGNYVNIDANSNLSVLKKYLNVIFKYTKPIINIEDNVGIGEGTIIYAIRSVHLKKYSMIGPYCFIADYDHNYEDVKRPVMQQTLTNIEPIVIEEGAWIGARSIICSGVTIGKNAVVGAGSVVTKNIPPFSVAVGVPAKVIKKYNFETKKWEVVK